MSKLIPLSESSMQAAEEAIPLLAVKAGQGAFERACALGTRLVMKSPDGQLIERDAQGRIHVLRNLPKATQVQVGLVLTRRSERLKGSSKR